MLLVILVSCESEELIEQDQEINYKQKLSEIITLNPVDEAYSKQETRNELPPLNFNTYKEAYKYFKQNKVVYSDTVTMQLKPINKNFKASSGSVTNNYSAYIVDNGNITNPYNFQTTTLITTYNLSAAITFNYSEDFQGNRTYTSYTIGYPASVGNIQVVMSGPGTITLSSYFIKDGGWEGTAQQVVEISGVIFSFGIEIKAFYSISPGQIPSSHLPNVNVTHSMQARYL